MTLNKSIERKNFFEQSLFFQPIDQYYFNQMDDYKDKTLDSVTYSTDSEFNAENEGEKSNDSRQRKLKNTFNSSRSSFFTTFTSQNDNPLLSIRNCLKADPIENSLRIKEKTIKNFKEQNNISSKKKLTEIVNGELKNKAAVHRFKTHVKYEILFRARFKLGQIKTTNCIKHRLISECKFRNSFFAQKSNE